MEQNMNFTVTGKITQIKPDRPFIDVDFTEATIEPSYHKHVIKTFSDATLIEEISNRYNCVITINKIKE